MGGIMRFRGAVALAVVAVTQAANPARADDISNVIYINRCVGGCDIIASNSTNDAHANISSIPDNDTTIGEWAHGDAVWDELVACVRETYAPYDVDVVTEEPGTFVSHHEAIVAGDPAEVGYSPDVGGIAVISGDCTPRNNVISFTFANSYPPSAVLNMCATVAQESAHSFGLDHVTVCRDPMTYRTGCGQKFFRNELLACGEIEERACRCDGNVQNSHAELYDLFGEGTPPAAPEVELLLPAAEAAVDPGFSIYASASDKRGVSRVDLLINNWRYDEREGHDPSNPYVFLAPGGLPDGYQHIKIRAFNDLGVMGVTTARVLLGEPCEANTQCNDGQTCEDGACLWPEPTGEFGDTCDRDIDCLSYLCASDGDATMCSEACFTGVPDTCPSGHQCLSTGGSNGLCWPGGGGGCCSTTRNQGFSWGQLMLFLGVVGTMLIRRRRLR